MQLDERAMANLEVALENVFRACPHGGNHESRKHVARKLMQSAREAPRLAPLPPLRRPHFRAGDSQDRLSETSALMMSGYGISPLLLPPAECGLFQKNSRLPVAASAYWSIATRIA